MIFGVGECPNAIPSQFNAQCRIVPTSCLGFDRVERTHFEKVKTNIKPSKEVTGARELATKTVEELRAEREKGGMDEDRFLDQLKSDDKDSEREHKATIKQSPPAEKRPPQRHPSGATVTFKQDDEEGEDEMLRVDQDMADQSPGLMTPQTSALSSKKETKKSKSTKKSKAGQGDFEEKP